MKQGHAFVDLDRFNVERSAIAQIPRDVAVEHFILPVKVQDNTLYLAISNPRDLNAIDAATLASQKRIIPVLATEDALAQAIRKYYPDPDLA